tara:strand:- start:611 stop:2203 length:1593 start_codon:yes stop_codon:yes gene_type:complete
MGICSYLFGMFNNIMEIDAMQYASMSRELLRNENFLHFFDNGTPYLDKPPMIFWVTSIFFKIFGASNFSYRLPSFLFSIIAIYSTFKLSNLYYSKRVSFSASLILSSCLMMIVINGDVRTDIYMISPMMVSIWQLAQYFKSKNITYLIIGSVAISLSMMGKGPLGFIIPIMVLGVNLIYNKDLNKLLDKNIVLGFIIITLFLLPMSFGLYDQFGFRGIKFFYWTQSFGRITGDSGWSNNTGPFYLLNVFFYSFFPWTILFIIAFFEKIKIVFNKKEKEYQEIISFSGFLLPLIILSLSNYKLPHYIYCVVPFASILLASKIDRWTQSKIFNKIYLFQNILLAFTIGCISIFINYTLPKNNIFYTFPIFVIIFFITYNHYLNSKLYRFFVPSIASSLILSYYINLGILGPILSFQSQSEAAHYLKENFNSNIELVFFEEDKQAKSRSFNYYLDINTVYVNAENVKENIKSGNTFIFTNEKGYQTLFSDYPNLKLLKIFDHYRISKIDSKFIIPKTRERTLQKKYLLQVDNI